MVEELLAQVVEEVSILAAKRFAREKPRTVERPPWVTKGAQSLDGGPDRQASAFSRALDKLTGFGAPRRTTAGQHAAGPPEHAQAAPG